MIKKIVLLVALMFVLFSVMACNTSKPQQPLNQTWLSPGKIQIGKLSPGNSVKQKIKIHNGNNINTEFLVYYRIPDYVETNFVTAPANVQDWITIAENSPILGPLETKEIEVVLSLPDKAQTPERWEFWIGVKENSQNTLATELCSRWLITMKNN